MIKVILGLVSGVAPVAASAVEVTTDEYWALYGRGRLIVCCDRRWFVDVCEKVAVNFYDVPLKWVVICRLLLEFSIDTIAGVRGDTMVLVRENGQ